MQKNTVKLNGQPHSVKEKKMAVKDDIFKEKSVSSISGVELKKKITDVADECYCNEDYQSAAKFYRCASEINESVMYKQIVEYRFSEFEGTEEE